MGSTTLGGTTPTLVTFFTELTLLKMSSSSSSGTDSRKVLPEPRLGSAASNGEASAESAASASSAPHHTLGLVTSYSCPPTCCVRVTVLVVVVGLAVVVVGVAVVPREQQPHRVVLRHGVQQLGVLAVDQVPPAAGLPALVVDRAVGAQPAELEAVDAGAHGAGVVHLAEGRHVRVVAVPQLVRAAAHRAALDTADCPAPT